MQIENLNKDLDKKEMTEVRGGDNGNSAVSTTLQALGIDAPIGVGYGAGSAGNTFVNIDPSQNASTSTEQTSGDKFAAFLGEVKREA
ncbi:MAG: hypothetical protein QOI59_5575 [Gammaproteobacteria bacterium]|jgi:hypothetical protein|nr:hypothetical protein [Gammaproteobacteria bacterium]HWM67148.1 hypothetical protein [Steroidobacteraceae bacterium]